MAIIESFNAYFVICFIFPIIALVGMMLAAQIAIYFADKAYYAELDAKAEASRMIAVKHVSTF